jgi:hypothetical protein
MKLNLHKQRLTINIEVSPKVSKTAQQYYYLREKDSSTSECLYGHKHRTDVINKVGDYSSEE